MKEGPLLKLQKLKGLMQELGRKNIVCQWKARTANTDMGRLEVKAQLTQQCKPMWLVEYNCPTHRSWQSNKAVTPVPRRTWLKIRWRRRKRPTKKSEGKLHWTKPWERRNWLGGATKSSTKKRRRWKGYALSLKGTRYDWYDQNKCQSTRDKKKKVLALSSTNINQRSHVPYQAGSMIGTIKASTNQRTTKGYVLFSKGKGDIIGGIKTSADQKGKQWKVIPYPWKSRKDLSWDERWEPRKSL